MHKRWLLMVLFTFGWAAALPPGQAESDPGRPGALNEVIWPIGG